MKKRNIGLAILFSFITFGIYAIYWFVVLTNDSNSLAPENATMSGGKAFLASIFTFGIYSVYWNYKLGAKVDEMQGDSNIKIVFLILGLFGFGIINYCIAQQAINKKLN